MGELHIVTQVEPVYCEGAVLFVVRGGEAQVKAAVGAAGIAVYVEEVEIRVVTAGCNLGDGEYVEKRTVVVLQSGSKYYDGTEGMRSLLVSIAPLVEDAAWFFHVAGFPELAFESFRISGGKLSTEYVEHDPDISTPEASMWTTTRALAWLHRAVLRRSETICELCREPSQESITLAEEPPLAGRELGMDDVFAVCARCDQRAKAGTLTRDEAEQLVWTFGEVREDGPATERVLVRLLRRSGLADLLASKNDSYDG
jgi:hypothetical protein